MEKKIVTADELAEELLCSKALIRQIWKQIPHFFVGRSTSMRGARFDVDDVVNFLKERDYAPMYEAAETAKREEASS